MELGFFAQKVSHKFNEVNSTGDPIERENCHWTLLMERKIKANVAVIHPKGGNTTWLGEVIKDSPGLYSWQQPCN